MTRRLIFLVSFFAYSGYYAGLALIYSVGLRSLSRNYSVPLRLFLAILMVIIILKSRKKIQIKSNGLVLVLFGIFWVYYIFKVLITQGGFSYVYLSRTWFEYIFYAITYVILPFYTFFIIDHGKYRNTILNGLIASGFILGVLSTYLYGSFLGSGDRLNMLAYITGEDILSPLALSYSGSLTIILCLYRFVVQKERRLGHVIYLISTIVLSGIMFLLGASRGSFIALLITIPILFILNTKKNKIGVGLLSLMLTVIVAILISISGSALFDRLSNLGSDQGGGRITLWENAFNHFLDYPIFGGKVEIGGIYPHNFILEILMSTGLVGLILITPVLVKGISQSIRISKVNKEYIFVPLILFQGIAQHMFTGGYYTATLLFLPLGLAIGLSYFSESREFNV